jgi:2',3'-cyclic-nucleotide 2'-phosphodiesterase (5'-nucleotidase family)
MNTSRTTTPRTLTRALRAPALALSLLLLLAPRGWAGRRLELTILHTNDVHGHMLPYDYGDQMDVGGAARRATLIDQIRRETHHPVLLVDSGDVITRGPLWTEFEGKLDIDVMNSLGYEIAAIGNNEFKVRADRSAQGVLLDLVRRSHFPWLAANAFDGTGGYLPGVQPYLVRKIDGVRVAFLGLTAPRSATYPQTVGWKISDPIEAARALLPKIRKEADVIIALTHIGYGLDLNLAAEDSDLDVIVGGDSHTYLPAMTLVQRPRDPLQATPSRRLGIPVVQDGEFGHDLGRLDLQFEQTAAGAWELRAAQWHTIPITASIPERADVASMLQRAAAPLSQPVGRVQISGSTVADREMATRRLIAQALKEETGADIGLVPAGTLFGIWKIGPISTYDVRYVLPFPDHAALVTVKGSDLAHTLTLPGMAIAGAEASSSTSGPAPELRVAGAPLDPDRTYHVAAQDFDASETPGLKGAPTETRGDIRDVVLQWLRQGHGQQVRARTLAR